MNLVKSVRRLWWWNQSFLKKQQKLIFSASLVGIFLFVLLNNILPLLPQFKSRQRLGIVGQYTLNTLPRQLTQL
jgi:hypothetical protein